MKTTQRQPYSARQSLLEWADAHQAPDATRTGSLPYADCPKTLSRRRSISPNIGRVGALAAALGIGAVIAAMPSVAFAETDGSDGLAGATTSSSMASDSGSKSTRTESAKPNSELKTHSRSEVADHAANGGPSDTPESDGVGEDDENLAADPAEPAADPVSDQDVPWSPRDTVASPRSEQEDAGTETTSGATATPASEDEKEASTPEASEPVPDMVEPPSAPTGAEITAATVSMPGRTSPALRDRAPSQLSTFLNMNTHGSGGDPLAPAVAPLMLGTAAVGRRTTALTEPTADQRASRLFGDGTAEHPDAGLLFGNGFSWDGSSCTGTAACHGGNAGLLGGSAGHGFNGGNGGAAGLFGRGGDGGDGRPDGSGGNGGRGGLISGDGGDGGDAGASLRSVTTAGVGGDSGMLGVRGKPGKGTPAPVTVGFPRSGTYVTEGGSGARVELLTVQLSGASATAVTVTYSVSNYTGAQYKATAGEDFAAATGSVVFAPGQTSATIPVTVYGDTDYEPDETVYVELTSAIGALIVRTATDGQLAGQSNLILNNDDRASGIGMTLHLRGADAATVKREFDLMAAMNVSWVRIDVDWSAVEPRRGKFQWESTDLLVREAVAHNMNVLVMLGFTPAWARSADTKSLSYPSHARAKDLAAFGAFASTAAARYAPLGVRSWEIWNEPNTAKFWPARPDADEYGALFRTAATAIRGVDSRATLLIGGLGPQYDTPGAEIPPAQYLDQLYGNGAAQLADGIAVHPYSYPHLPMDPQQRQEGGFADLPELQAVMAGHGDGDKLIWITEFGAPTGTSVNAVSEEQQAAILLAARQQVAQWNWAGPLVYYELVDGGTDPSDGEQNFGVLRKDLSPKAAALALMESDTNRRTSTAL